MIDRRPIHSRSFYREYFPRWRALIYAPSVLEQSIRIGARVMACTTLPETYMLDPRLQLLQLALWSSSDDVAAASLPQPFDPASAARVTVRCRYFS